MAAAVPKSGEVYYAEDGTVSIVLDDNWDPNYDPPQKEVDEYAKWLGIDVNSEKDLLWIARDGLKAPLPKEWKPCKTDTGDVYYFNFKSGESIWDHPMDEIYKKKVEDERAKLQKSGKGDKPKALVKGGAGSTDNLKPMSRAAIEEVRPKSGRLGAIGTVDEQKTIRPDISALLPTKSEQITASFLGAKGGKKEPLKDMKEMERNFRKKYDSEFEAQRKVLSEKYDRQLTELKQQLSSELKKQSGDSKADMEDEIDQTRRNLERRNKRELQLYEESLDKQKEDIRRTLQLTQEKLTSETSGANRRVDAELSEKRSAAERQMTQDISRKRQELQEGWQREKTQAEMETQSKLRDIRTSHELRVERMRQQESSALLERIRRLEDELVAETAAAKEQLRAERASHTQRLREETSKSEAGATSEYNLANAQFQAAVAEAQRESDEMLRRERAALQAATEAIKLEFTAKKSAAERDCQQHVAQSADALTLRRQAAERRAIEAESDLQRRLEEEKRAFEVETSRLVSETRAAAEAAARGSAAMASDARVREEQTLAEQRRVSLEQLDTAHRIRMSSIKTNASANRAGEAQDPIQTTEYNRRLTEKKELWLQTHPAAVYHLPSLPPIPVFDPNSVVAAPIIVTNEVEAAPTSAQIAAVVDEAVADAMRSTEREHDAKIESLRKALTESQRSEFEEHQSKARRGMEERLQSYRAGGGSPMRRASTRVAAAKANAVSASAVQPPNHVPPSAVGVSDLVPFGEAEGRLSDLRATLQRELNALIERLSYEAGEKLSAVAAAQAELDALSAQIAVADRVMPPTPTLQSRPDSAMSVHQNDGLVRSHTADAAMFLTSGPARSTTPVLHASMGGGGSHNVTPMSRTNQNQNRNNSGVMRSSSFEDRLAKAHELLHRKKKEIRARQKHLEEVREDWKRDMAAAKASRDEKQISTLKHVADALEMDARQLNKEALALKESYECLRRESDTYAQQNQARYSGNGSGARYHGDNRSPQPTHRSHSANGGVGSSSRDVGSLLAQILQRTDAVEQQVARVESQHASPIRRGGGGNSRDVTVSKWSSWLQQHTKPHHGDPDVVAGDTQAPPQHTSPRKAASVAMWVKEQQTTVHQ